jgi:putative PIN family toxin of toxin-antitoxin system
LRAVLDPNVLVSALLSRGGTPAQILARWIEGEFELVVSTRLLNELERTLGYPKIAERLDEEESAEFVQLLRDHAVLAADRDAVPERAPDPGDDHLIALAEAERALLVSGDRHLLGLADELPIVPPRVFLETLETQR